MKSAASVCEFCGREVHTRLCNCNPIKSAALSQEPINVRETFGVPFDVEQELRREWWTNHGCDFLCLYGDDGEMACNCCGTDFKRLPIEALRGVVYERRLLRAQEASESV